MHETPHRQICAPTSKYDSVMMWLWRPWIWNFRSLFIYFFFWFSGVMFIILYILCVFGFGLNLNHRRAISGSSKCPFLRCNSLTLLALFASLRRLLTIDILSHTEYFMTTGKQQKQKHKYGDIPIIVPTAKCSAYKQMRKKLQQRHRESERWKRKDRRHENKHVQILPFYHA